MPVEPGAVAGRRAPEWRPTGTTCASVYRRSLVDLAALRFYPESVPSASLPAAGLPWFMALFGRDSLITSYQALPFVPELARTTLRALGRPAGDRVRRLPRRRARARSCTSCATASWPTSASGRSRRTTGRPTRRRCSSSCWTSTSAGPATSRPCAQLEPAGPGRAWSGWSEYGDLDGDGYIEYQTRNPADRPGEPVLEGLVELDRPPGRHASPTRRSATLRDPGVRLRRAACVRPGWPARCGAIRTLADRLETRRRRAAAPLRPRLLAAGARLLRAGPGRRQEAGARP